MSPSIIQIRFTVNFYKPDISACNETNIDFTSLQCLSGRASLPAVMNNIL